MSETAEAWGLPQDREAAEAQMGRPLQGRSRVASRCHLKLPVVLEVHPDWDGRPFPTLYYLTCPLARIRVSRLEAAGGVREWTARVAEEPALAKSLAEAHDDYAARRESLLEPEHPLHGLLSGGVGGGRGVKCLHAHYAHARVGGANPIGEAVLSGVEPLDCRGPCVADGASVAAWREPGAPRS